MPIMTLETLKGVDTITDELVAQAADELVDRYKTQSAFNMLRLPLDKEPGFSEENFQRALDIISRNSAEGQYSLKDRPLKFFVHSVSIDDLSSPRDGFINFLQEDPVLNEYIRDLVLNKWKAGNWIYDDQRRVEAVPVSYFYTRSADPSFLVPKIPEGTDLSGFRKVLTALGNPVPASEESPPALIVPIINFKYPDVPENAIERLNEFNQKYYDSANDQGFLPQKKWRKIFTPDEIALAKRASRVVNTFESLFYDGYDRPAVRAIYSAPFFPYEALRRHYGGYYEGWMGGGPNDDLVDLFKSKQEFALSLEAENQR